MQFWRRVFLVMLCCVICFWTVAGIALYQRSDGGVYESLLIVAGVFLGIANAAAFGFCYAVLDGLQTLVQSARRVERRLGAVETFATKSSESSEATAWMLEQIAAKKLGMKFRDDG